MAEAKPPLGLRERNKLDKQQRIREAARTLFAERGFAATTVDQVAQAAGVAKGTVFLYAKDKYDLLYLVFEEGISSAYESAFASLPEASLPVQLAYVFGTFFDFYGRHPGLSKVILREVIFSEGEQRDRYQAMTMAFFGRLAALFQARMDSGELRRDLDLMLAVTHVFAFYGMTLAEWLQAERPDPAAARLHLEQSYRLMIEGFATRP